MDCTVHRHSHTFTATYTPRHNRNGQTEAPSCCLNATVLLFWPRLVFNYQGCPNVHNQHNQHGVDYVQIIMNKYNLNLSKSLEKIARWESQSEEFECRLWYLSLAVDLPPVLIEDVCWCWSEKCSTKPFDYGLERCFGWKYWCEWWEMEISHLQPAPPPFSHWFICKLRLETFMSPLRPYQHHTG